MSGLGFWVVGRGDIGRPWQRFADKLGDRQKPPAAVARLKSGRKSSGKKAVKTGAGK